MFVAVSWAAVVFAVFGLLAVLLDRDPVPPGVNSYYGILELAVAAVIVWLAVATVPRARSPWPTAMVAAASVYLLGVLSGAVGGMRLVASQATSPFAIAAATLAAVTVIVAWAGIRMWRAR